MTDAQRRARSETRRRTVTAVHASRTPEQRAAIAKKAHVGRDYATFREAMQSIPKEARQKAAAKGHARRDPCKLQQTWAAKDATEIQAIFKQRVATAKANGNYTVTSKMEDQAFRMLHKVFGDVLRQHADDRYPWPCDFYLT